MRFTDETIQPGVAYEYQVMRTARDIVDVGYLDNPASRYPQPRRAARPIWSWMKPSPPIWTCICNGSAVTFWAMAGGCSACMFRAVNLDDLPRNLAAALVVKTG